MRKLFFALFVVVLFSSCKKDVVRPPMAEHPVMYYKDLQDAVVKYQQYKIVDIDDDGKNDYYFEVLLVGDPILQRDRIQFYANSGTRTHLLANEPDQTPVLNVMDSISLVRPGFEWYPVSAIVLAEKIVPVAGNPYWEGNWKSASHKYLPLQLVKEGKLYHGWIELSVDAEEERVILHRAGLSTKENLTVKAGY